MAKITAAGASNWRAAFDGHPGVAVTAENYALLTAPRPEPEHIAAPEPEVVPDPIPGPVSTPPESSPGPSEEPSDEPELVRLSDSDEGHGGDAGG